MKSMKSWDVGYEAGVSGKPMPATPEGGDSDQLAHGYAAGEETYLASIRREDDEQEQPCSVCEHNSAIRWWIAAMGLAAWAIVGALGAIAWGVLR